MSLFGGKSGSVQLEKKIQGEKNVLDFSPSVKFTNCKVDIIGNNNTIQIGEHAQFVDMTFYIRGDNSRIIISNNVVFKGGESLWIADPDCLIEIKSNCTFERDCHIAATEPHSRILIGEDCMFAYEIDVRTGDSHSIIDAKTNKRINYAKDVIIGDHVWIAAHCSILKGVELKKNSIVATRSVVTKSFEKEGIVIGGSPAKILKEAITWSRKRIYDKEK